MFYKSIFKTNTIANMHSIWLHDEYKNAVDVGFSFGIEWRMKLKKGCYTLRPNVLWDRIKTNSPCPCHIMFCVDILRFWKIIVIKMRVTKWRISSARTFYFRDFFKIQFYVVYALNLYCLWFNLSTLYVTRINNDVVQCRSAVIHIHV